MAVAITEEQALAELAKPLGGLERDMSAAYARYEASNSTASGALKDFKILSPQELIDKIVAEMRRNEKLMRLICVDLDYCKNRKSQMLKIFFGIVDAITIAHSYLLTMFPVPVATVTAYMLKSGVLDKVCSCAEN